MQSKSFARGRSWRGRRVPALVAVLLAGAGCAGGPAPGKSLRGCPSTPGEAEAGGSFTFALTDWVGVEGPFTPIPRNDSEAIVYRLAYETLLNIDCRGQIVAGLVESFDYSRSRASWRFELPADAGFSSGEALTPETVERSWIGSRTNFELVAPDLTASFLWFWNDFSPATIHPGEAGRLFVEAATHESELPLLLTMTPFSIVRHGAAHDRSWPPGTRGELEGPRTRAGRVNLVWTAEPGDRQTKPSEIRFRILRDADPRDLVASDVDAFFVRNREAVRYLERVEGYRVTPFPWSRLYVLLVPDPEFAARLDLDLRDLARSSAIADARPAPPIGEWTRAGARGAPPPPIDTGGSRRVFFPRGDVDARALAARIASLASRDGDTRATATHLVWPGEFLAALAAGRDAAYVLPVFPKLPNDRLLRFQLLRCAPWLADHGRAIALVETRGHLVSRLGLAGIYAPPDGIPRLDQAGWERGAQVP